MERLQSGAAGSYPNLLPMPRTPKPEKPTLCLLNVRGDKMAVYSEDDRNKSTKSVVGNVLTVRSYKNKKSTQPYGRVNKFTDMFEGMQHAATMILDSERYGKYSYRCKSERPLEGIRDFLRENANFKLDARKPYAEDNVRVDVKILADGEELPMSAIYTQEDLVALCTRTDEFAGRWRERHAPLTQEKEFFWGAEADSYTDLDTLVAEASEDSQEQRDF